MAHGRLPSPTSDTGSWVAPDVGDRRHLDDGRRRAGRPAAHRHRPGVRGAAALTAFATILAGAVLVAPHAAAASRPAAGSLVTAPNLAAAQLPGQAPPMAAAGRMASFDAEMVSLVNGARRGAGLPTLTQAGGLTELSVWWSDKMARGDTGYQLEHNPNAWTMVTQYGASNRTAWAENVASFTASASAQAVFDAYMNSPGHRANIMGAAYHYIGMGTVSGSHGAYNTMEFTDKVDGASAPQPAPTTKAAPKPAPTTKAAPKPAPTTKAAPKPAPTTKAAPKPAPVTKAAPKPAPVTKSTPRPEATANPPEQLREIAYQAPAPVAQHGRLVASIGSLPVPGLTFSIRDASCKTQISTATTGRDGTFAITAMPGTYCAVPDVLPAGFRSMRPVTFTVGSGGAFTVAVDHLQPVAMFWRARGSALMRPV